ncbi:MAG: tRNA (N(6)-L-threonylcarbamoyladenosine(37)-C(2))-methylthiotransferase MtaB [Clostridia bacterium]|nr:tRNA (N(6)-L-threonylcarbamoyladenosine(37)-C(2))-methylthiotransferase MtaB [Clostridia bacterium]
MKQKFIDNGYKIVNFEEIADIYIVNTCTVTNMADRKSRQILRRPKQINPNSLLVIVGCYVQVGKKELEKIEEIDLILGNNEKNNILEYVEKYKEKQSIVSDINNQKEYKDFGETTYTEKVRAFIKIQDGCNNFCSYCIIPFARGRVRSRKIENVVSEITDIAKKGIKEVVITGIHIASYGIDFDKKIGLIDLLEKINKIDGIERIRLGSLEPKLITEQFLEKLSKLEKICDQFHMSLQSGCDETLKRMNRRYTTQDFEKGVKILRNAYPNSLLTADIIVGFPGETEEEFNTTYDFLKKIGFYKIHTFKYSKRKGTIAEKMPNQISNKLQEERSKKIIELSNDMQNKYNDSYIGKKVKVLFEEKEGEVYKGHTSNYMLIRVKAEENLENEIKVVQIENNSLIGKIL